MRIEFSCQAVSQNFPDNERAAFLWKTAEKGDTQCWVIGHHKVPLNAAEEPNGTKNDQSHSEHASCREGFRSDHD